VIVDKTAIFMEHLDRMSTKGEEFSLQRLTNNLVIDVIGTVMTGANFHAQDLENPGEFGQVLQEMFISYASEQLDLPWWFTPFTSLTRRRLSQRMRAIVKKAIRDAYAAQPQAEKQLQKPSSILGLVLRDIHTLTPEIEESLCEQLRPFLWAGQDTTSKFCHFYVTLASFFLFSPTSYLEKWFLMKRTMNLFAMFLPFFPPSKPAIPYELRLLIDLRMILAGTLVAWTIYELSRTPHALKAVRAEAYELFGAESDIAKIRDILVSGDGDKLLHRMTYTAAVIKETLRLWPPASSARLTKPGTGLTVQTSTGQSHCLDGVLVYLCASIIQRDPKVYGDTANNFVPERWLNGNAENIPPSAWRPFERGPRACIGLELASLEARVVVALVAQRYDFFKIGIGESVRDEAGQPVLGVCGQYLTEPEIYTVSYL
jgi:cytochrome P450